ncbi:MAG: hypothetical protein L0Y72_03825 [Gemmataceae bacterium]|nr:hypothetical protein [Gemmataceae bacterium]MCI0738148.1 hypothetical protein [Gemmataceae bacterium]
MAAAPWYLLAAGVALVIVGVILLNLSANTGRRGISHKMSDKEIIRRMQGGWGEMIARILIFLGGAIILVSIVWRIVRIIASY